MTDQFDFKAETEPQKIGLLLPAVQAAREAAREAPEIDAGDKLSLLLPAVQTAETVKEAGLKSDGELVQAATDGADSFAFKAAKAPGDGAGSDLALTGEGWDAAAQTADGGHKEWIPILDISHGPIGPAADEPTGASHHDDWVDLA